MGLPKFRKRNALKIAPAPVPTDRRGTKFDARIHARDESGKPKEDSLGHFILAEHDYQTPRNTHYPDSFRHAPKNDGPDAA